MKIAMLIIMFLFIGAFFIVSQNNLSLNNSENIDKFTETYIDWINNFTGKIVGGVGYAVKLEWLPEDSVE